MSSGSSSPKNTTQTQMIDPQMKQWLMGSGGLFPSAKSLYDQGAPDYYQGQTYTPFNDAQNTAVAGITNYANSNAANAGANAYRTVGNTLVDRLNNGTDWNAAPMQSVTGANVQGPTADYSPALNQALSGSPNNPWLDQQANGIVDKITRNYQENIAPATRAGAEMAGQYGSSRQGIAEGVQQRGMNDDIANTLANLYGAANESAQNRAASTAALLAGQSQQANLANAGYQQQANLANQGVYADALRMGMGADQFNTNAALQGAGALQTGSQIPYSNYGQILQAQDAAQTDQNNVNQANLAAWDYNANKDINWLKNYASIIQPGAGLGSGTQTQQQMYRNPLGGAMGGGLLGYGVGSLFGGGAGAAAGTAAGTAAGAAGGAAGGAASGSSFGPYGALAGAALGYLLR